MAKGWHLQGAEAALVCNKDIKYRASCPDTIELDPFALKIPH